MTGNKLNKTVLWRSLLITLGVVGLLALALFGLIGVSVAAPANPVVQDPEPQPRLAGALAPTGKSTLGDYVWYDQNVDGEHTTTPGEFEYSAGINNVRVNLYEDLNTNTVIDAGEFVTYTHTGPNPAVGGSGWYSFSVTADGTWYIVEIDSSNFAAGGPLENHVHTSIGTYGTWANKHLAVMPGIAIFDYNYADFGYALSQLEISKELISAPGGWVVVSDTVTYRITVRNTGHVTMTKVPLYDYYNPACLRFLNAGPPQTSVDKALGTITWADLTVFFGPLPPGGSFPVDVTFHAQKTDEMYWKEGSKPDYAPKGMPDFDQKQDQWDNPPLSGQNWYTCGPVAAANSLWWFDSKFEPSPVPPPTINDGYPLVPAFGAWDDHDAQNVQPLVNTLALPAYLNTQPGTGTDVNALYAGVAQYITDRVGLGQYTVTLVKKPEFEWVEEEIRRSEDVILLLGFWQETVPGVPQSGERVGGHYVTVAGVNSITPTIGFSDPYRNWAEQGLSQGRVFPGPHGALHPSPGPISDTVHNNTKYLSQDVYPYQATTTPGGLWGPEGYVNQNPTVGCSQIANFQFQNVPPEFLGSQKTCSTLVGYRLWTEVEYAVAVSPIVETIICDPTNNIAVVIGAEDILGNEAPDVQSEHDTHVVDPRIQVVKTAGNAADGAIEYLNGPTPVGVTYTFAVTNPGDTPLGSVNLSDDTCTGVVTGPALGDDADGDGLLDTTETWTYTCAHSEGDNGLTTNTATVTGNPTDGSGNDLPDIPDVSDTDDADIFVVNPDIQVVKTPDLQYLVSGETATGAFRFSWLAAGWPPIAVETIVRERKYAGFMPVQTVSFAL